MDGLTVSNFTNSVQTADELRSKTAVSQMKPKSADEIGDSFADSLKQAINTVDRLQKDADNKMRNLATGKSENIHETMIAAEKADLAFRLMVQVRNKVIDAYQDIMKMQV